MLTHDLLLTLHFLGLSIGGAASFGLPVLGAVSAKLEPAQRPVLGRLVLPLRRVGQVGLVTLVVTGVLLAIIDGVFSGGPVWFWIKLAGVLALIVGVVVAGRISGRVMAGVPGAAAQAKTMGMVNIGILIFILLSASLAFH